jgi:hypothetical protein
VVRNHGRADARIGPGDGAAAPVHPQQGTHDEDQAGGADPNALAPPRAGERDRSDDTEHAPDQDDPRLFLPVMAGLWVWETTWPLVLRVMIIVGLAGWNLLVLLPRWLKAS